MNVLWGKRYLNEKQHPPYALSLRGYSHPMTSSSIVSLRLANQQIAGTKFRTPEQIVSYFSGMQAQDYGQAKWAIGLRLPGSTDADIEEAILRKKIVRTWAMRGTLQFLAAKDYRWIHSLLAHRYQSADTSRNRQLGLDVKTFQRACNIIVSGLQEEKILTRKEIGSLLNKSGIKTDQNRLSHMLHYATMHQLICFGPRKGKEFSFVLLDDWIPSQRTLSRDKALAELAKRYFVSRGPATLQDFVWWSGLSQTEAKNGIDRARPFLKRESTGGRTYRSDALDPRVQSKAVYINGIFHPIVLVHGRVAGIWRPVAKNKSMTMRLELFSRVSKTVRKDIENEFNAYRLFIGTTKD